MHGHSLSMLGRVSGPDKASMSPAMRAIHLGVSQIGHLVGKPGYLKYLRSPGRSSEVAWRTYLRRRPAAEPAERYSTTCLLPEWPVGSGPSPRTVSAVP